MTRLMAGRSSASLACPKPRSSGQSGKAITSPEQRRIDGN
jgi:hypothetical protein